MFSACDIAERLDRVLQIKNFVDVSHNGLQIENRGAITNIALGVDASMETFEAAVAQGAQMLLVHHGLSWGDSLARIQGLNYQLVEYAIRHNLAVYAAHLPLDAHPTLGNNAQLADLINLQDRVPFMAYHGVQIGVAGLLPKPMTRDDFVSLVREQVRPLRMEVFAEGVDLIRSVGICSGGAPEGLEQAAAEKLDVYLCGEANLIAYNLAKHLHINGVFAGHYATEVWGVKALGAWISKETGLPSKFIKFDIPY